MRGGAACERHRGGWHIAAAVPKAAKGTKRNRAKRDNIFASRPVTEIVDIIC